jgi:hypothetical protein
MKDFAGAPPAKNRSRREEKGDNTLEAVGACVMCDVWSTRVRDHGEERL